MANRKLLRQYVTDYQRDIEKSVADAKAGYAQYSGDTTAFNELVQKGYDTSAKTAATNQESDLDNVGFNYYDRDTKANVSAGNTRAPVPMQTFDKLAAPPEGTKHNATYGESINGGLPFDPLSFAAKPYLPGETFSSRLMAANKPLQDAGIGFDQTPYWDAYDKVWRNAPSAGVAPVQRQVNDPNLTNKEIGILQGKAPSYAEQAMNMASKNSAFNDPQDPSNLKDAGVLARAIAGQI